MKKTLTLLFILCLLIATTSCNNSSKQTNLSSYYNFDAKTAMEEKGDGWLYFFSYEYKNGGKSPGNISYIFNGYNLKYKHIDGYDIQIIDNQTGKIVDTATSSLPYLTLDKEINSDIEKINNFFTKKQFITSIKMSDLGALALNKINKQDVLKLFNKAIGKDKLGNGKYYYLPEADVVQEKLINGYQWQVGFFIAHGNIFSIRIELIYNGNIYLSDLIDNNKADKSQKNIYDKIKQIEKNIMEKQSFDIDNEELTIDNIKFRRLYELLKKINSGGYKN